MSGLHALGTVAELSSRQARIEKLEEALGGLLRWGNLAKLAAADLGKSIDGDPCWVKAREALEGGSRSTD